MWPPTSAEIAATWRQMELFVYANSKMVNNISVALSVFKGGAQIFIVGLVNLGGGFRASIYYNLL